MIARAKKIDSNEVIEGNYFKEEDDSYVIMSNIKYENYHGWTGDWNFIDPSTLEYSFNGINFYSEDLLVLLTARYEAMLIKGGLDD